MSIPFDLHSAAVSDSHLQCHVHDMLRPCRSSEVHSTAVLCCGLEMNGMVGAWHGHGMVSVNQTRPHCVNQTGKTHSKLLSAGHDRGTAWAWHAMCESALKSNIAIVYFQTRPTLNVVFSYFLKKGHT